MMRRHFSRSDSRRATRSASIVMVRVWLARLGSLNLCVWARPRTAALVSSRLRSMRRVFATGSRSHQRKAKISLRLAPVNAAMATIEYIVEPLKLCTKLPSWSLSST